MSALCPSCSTGDESVEFDTVAELVKHAKEGHRSRPPRKLAPPKPVTPSATEQVASRASHDVDKTVHAAVAEAKPVKPRPLVLRYQWTGQCPDCGSEPRTIEVDIDKETVTAVAFCFGCNKQLSDKRVAKIPRS